MDNLEILKESAAELSVAAIPSTRNVNYISIEDLRLEAQNLGVETSSNRKSLTIEQFGPGWKFLVEKNAFGELSCMDGTSGKRIRLAPNIEQLLKNPTEGFKSNYSINAPLEFTLSDLIFILTHPNEYLKFIERNYPLGKFAEEFGKTLDTPRIPFFGLYSFWVENAGLAGQNPLFAAKLGKFAESQNSTATGRAKQRMSIIDKFFFEYRVTLFERRATKIVVTNGKLIATEYDLFLKGSELSFDNIMAKGALKTIAPLALNDFVVAKNAGEGEKGVITKVVKLIRKIPFADKLI